MSGVGKRRGADATARVPLLTSFASSCAVHALRFSPETSLLAVGGDGIQILHVDLENDSRIRLLHAVPLGARVTALDWTSNSRISEGGGRALVVACTDGIRIVSADVALDGSAAGNERIVACGTGGHRLKITAVACCRASGCRDVFASVSKDGRCLIWRSAADEADEMSPVEDRPRVTAIRHCRPLVDVAFHPRTFGLLATLDESGTVQLLDWAAATASPRSPPTPPLTFLDPAGGAPGACQGSLDFATSSPFAGAAIGSRFVIWNAASAGSPISGSAFSASSADVFKCVCAPSAQLMPKVVPE